MRLLYLLENFSISELDSLKRVSEVTSAIRGLHN